MTLDARTKELVAIAASVAGHCQPCFRHHMVKAVELGVTDTDIKNTIELAKRISGVGDQRMAEFVENVLKEGRQEEKR